MARKAVIKNGKVVNVIEADDNFKPGPEYGELVDVEEMEVKPSIGWDIVGKTFIKPKEPEKPIVVSVPSETDKIDALTVKVDAMNLKLDQLLEK